MKRILTLGLALCTIMTSFAQTDTITKPQVDTIKVGGMIILREPGNDSMRKSEKTFKITNRRGDKPSNITTNWWIIDLGFSNWNDQTIYGPGTPSSMIAPGSTEDWFKVKGGQSRSVNIWVFMQRINMIQHIVNLKYGLGLELNNYFFEDKTITFHDSSPTFIDQSYEHLTKNKLATDYLTMPVMLDFNFTPTKRRGYGISAGISAGYLYSSRQKIKLEGDVDKTKGNFDLRRWKLSYVGEISLGYIKLYGSYAFKSMFEDGLDLTPYNFGIRLSSM